MIKKKKKELLKKMTDFNYSESEIKLVEKAIDFAVEKHDKQLRKSGEPYIIHPIAVAILLVELYLDTNSISAAILHDVIEDTECTEEEIKKQFNDDIAQLVVLVTKVSNVSKINRGTEDYQSKEKNDYIIQVFMSISIDIRAIIIKITDRLHNMRTIEHLQPEKQKRIAKETLEIYANIAGRLGLFSIKTELLNICFRVLHQEEYNELTKTVNAEIELKGEKFELTVENIEKILNNNSINYEIKRRIKGVYSTYLKNEFETNTINCTDLFGIRIIVDDIMDCYAVLGLIHLNYYHIKSNLKDYISNPKANLYQSIHTTIIYEDSTIEVQIRTKNMDLKNEFGIAGHWKYKEAHEKEHSQRLIQNMISDYLSGNIQQDEKLLAIKEISKNKIIEVFYKNEKVWLPIINNSNAIDFVSKFSKEKFPYLNAFYINNKRVSWDSTIQSGDIISIEFSKFKTINRYWLQLTKKTTTKNLIRTELKEIDNIEKINIKKFLSEIISKDSTISSEHILETIKAEYNELELENFIKIVSEIKIDDIVNIFSSNPDKNIVKIVKNLSHKFIHKKSLFAEIKNIEYDKIKISDCCSKVPTLDIVGILESKTLSIHRFGCKTIEGNEELKRVIVEWNLDKIKKTDRYFKAKIRIHSSWSTSLSSKIINIFIKYRANISNFFLNKNKIEKTCIIDIELYVKNYQHLEKMMNELMFRNTIDDWELI